ncbi:hypothetical protein [Burkholderia sp. Ac-20379]|uniref:hypothetical protein n=1 Tax=Burkholderia sp. Ac-20379 TaxID=2703900 RepID=UPI0019802E80|nr:hypothetical protein [Burkholderia sp. Ac-20379]MBN3726531.1 hypothetical protein [Burkholderia sp. Ac-20379]
MLPSIPLCLGVKKIRDGGSLIASFQGSNGQVYWLMLPIDRSGAEVFGYFPPLVVERPFGCDIEISWQHARILFEQIIKFLPDGYENSPKEIDRASGIETMRRVLRNEGTE